MSKKQRKQQERLEFVRKVWEARQENYLYHYARRIEVKALLKDGLGFEFLPFRPRVNYFGDVEATYFRQLADRFPHFQTSNIPLLYIRWYWSEEYWKQYVDEFNALPDPGEYIPYPVDKPPFSVDNPAKDVDNIVRNLLTDEALIHTIPPFVIFG